jgi:hypothetical protein
VLAAGALSIYRRNVEESWGVRFLVRRLLFYSDGVEMLDFIYVKRFIIIKSPPIFFRFFKSPFVLYVPKFFKSVIISYIEICSHEQVNGWFGY